MEKLYSSIGIKKIVSINDDFETNLLNYENKFIKKNLRISTKQNYLNLKIKNILVGELMYDFYLRYFKKYTMNFNDKYEITKIACYVSTFLKNLNYLLYELGLKNIDRYIPWQAAYIQCGVLYFFYIKKIQVIGKSQEIFSANIQKRFLSQCSWSKKKFSKFKNKNLKLKQSLKSLKSRYGGNINGK